MVAEERNDDPAESTTSAPRGDHDSNNNNYRVLGLLFIFSMLMFSLPFGAFYMTKYLLLTYWHVNGFVNTVWSVVAAVGTMYVIILTYAYKAYREDRQDQLQQALLNKQD